MWRGSAYSGFCPTSTIAKLGPVSSANSALRWGNAARTSGHQGNWVFGSLDDTKAIKSFGSGPSGRASCLTDAGTAKVSKIGILAKNLNLTEGLAVVSSCGKA